MKTNYNNTSLKQLLTFKSSLEELIKKYEGIEEKTDSDNILLSVYKNELNFINDTLSSPLHTTEFRR